MNKQCYIAAPFFTLDQIKVVESIKNLLTSLKIRFFSPKDEFGIVERRKVSDAERRRVFKGNVNGMHNSSFSIAVIDDFDKGVLWEMGFMYGLKIPIIGFSSVKDRGLNMMLQFSAKKFVNGIDALREVLISKF